MLLVSIHTSNRSYVSLYPLLSKVFAFLAFYITDIIMNPFARNSVGAFVSLASLFVGGEREELKLSSSPQSVY